MALATTHIIKPIPKAIMGVLLIGLIKTPYEKPN
jgi:hypothetical protein